MAKGETMRLYYSPGQPQLGKSVMLKANVMERSGEPLAKVGDVGRGLSIILYGEVDLTGHDPSGQPAPMSTVGPGAFLGELGQLAGRPALVTVFPEIVM